MAASSTRPSSRRKGLLFCPDCGHESPHDGDWRVRRTPGGDAYHCPVCRATVTVRAAAGGRAAGGGPGGAPRGSRTAAVPPLVAAALAFARAAWLCPVRSGCRPSPAR